MEELIPIFIAVIVFMSLVGLYFIYITSPKKKGKSFGERSSLSIIPTKWIEVQAMMTQGGPANFRQSIIEADKLVDLALKSKVSGETMGDRLKNARNLFSRDTYDKLWTAHKIRNKIAHEADFEGLSSDANLCIRNFEKALTELRVI